MSINDDIFVVNSATMEQIAIKIEAVDINIVAVNSDQYVATSENMLFIVTEEN